MTNKAKIAISISQKHNQWLEIKSEDMGINKSALVSICIDSYIKNQEVISSITDMGPLLKQLSDLNDKIS